MSQTGQLVDTLKTVLRERKVTYADVGLHLGLSEANVKRMFSKRHFTLARIEQICALVKTDLTGLVERMNDSVSLVSELSRETESELVANIKLLMMAQLLLNRWSVDDITATYRYDEHETTQLLAQLDRLGVIELLPGNRVRNRLARDFKWIHNGPVYNFFRQHVSTDFFNTKFNPKRGELLIFLGGMLSKENNEKMHKRMRHLARDFDEFCQEDGKRPVHDTFGTGFVLALRPWELQVFAEYRHEPNQKQFKR